MCNLFLTFKFLFPFFLELDYISIILTYVIIHLVLYLNLDLDLDLGLEFFLGFIFNNLLFN
jgi:hypothetical protein